ncbi:MAG: glycoside hydrolase family 38 C-terminal domain-containing protein [Hespellia sp.]|nr:glycoside hydrolase family 38 C-terminal domain-containing protein [Hespellia sp.]
MGFTIYLIHHSHTDIGYTDYQEQIEANQICYIRHVLSILDHAHSDKPEWLGYVWQCECWWVVEKFLETASGAEAEQFWNYVKSGEIGLSASYFNMTELIDREVLGKFVKKAGEEAGKRGMQVKSAMTADINGYSWGYADALADAGVENLLSFVHTHHGRYPLYQKQTPFWWIAPSGREILVWLGDHYQVGNELGVSGLWAKAYTCGEDGLGDMQEGNIEQAQQRIYHYVETLKKQGYAYDFTALGISGYFTDNACPSPLITEFVQKFNLEHAGEIEFQMVTLDEYFACLKRENEKQPFPKYRGDWTDWWADGVGSTPVLVQHFREAQRRLMQAEQLQKQESFHAESGEDTKLWKEAQENLMLYAEHTWGHSASVQEPYDPGVNRLDLRKGLYAQRAHEAASRILLQIAKDNGALPAFYGQGERKLVVLNPEKSTLKDVVCFETEELYAEEAEVWDICNEKNVICQREKSSRGERFYFEAELLPGERREYLLKKGKKIWHPTGGIRTPYGAEGICDMPSEYLSREGMLSPWHLENDWVRIQVDETYQITEIYDKKRKISLLRKGAEYAPFTPVYERTFVTDKDQYGIRKAMGRNRKSIATKRYPGQIQDIRILENGAVFDKIAFHYALEGTKICQVILTVYRRQPRIDVDLRLHKKSVWDPENLYLAMPFSGGKEDICWIEKTGCALRPGQDQLPGSCRDFYLIQNGAWFTGERGSVLVAMPDTPLVAFGGLRAHPIVLSGETEAKSEMMYSWVMNNFWETNFKVDLGGFHQYRYSIFSLEETDAERIREIAAQQNRGLFTFQSFLLRY